MKLIKSIYRVYAPWEKAFDNIATPFEHFIHRQTTAGIILMVMTILALIVANSPLYDAYHHFFEIPFGVTLGGYNITHSLHHWINDGLMAMFFFVVGLEIKREILVGELANMKQATLPIVGAIGGMVVPAGLYALLNINSEGINGWGIPMATDIAFAVSALVILGKRVPKSLVTFLVALAIVDDLGAVAVIAIFYTEQIHMTFLMFAMGSFALMLVFNRVGIHKVWPYFILGGFTWVCMLESGIHATIAGILTALAVPAKPKFNPSFFREHMTNIMVEYDKYPVQENNDLHESQKALLHNIEESVRTVTPPLNRLEHDFHIPVSLLILPLFAFANAGIPIEFDQLDEVFSSMTTIGIMVGLVIGKLVGISGAAWLTIKLGFGEMPKGANMSQLMGVSCLAGIGFTMSIFIAGLAFPNDPEILLHAKIGILAASILAGVVGFVWLHYLGRDQKD
ncbi:MAG: Na+/H+ antiporter NhaA [Pseudomonadales bacterium]|nr:Na+/H+ antiporter NhaA [Pseudomonadales bacterium]